MAGRQTAPGAGQDFTARARRIHAETIGIDSHIDTLQRVLNGKEDISRRTGKGHVDLPRLREAGMRAPFFALYVPTYYKGAEAVRRTLQLRDAMQSVLDAHPDQIELALSASDIERIGKTAKIAAVFYDRERARHRRRPRGAADVSPARYPLHDPDPLPQHELGRFVH